MNRPSKQRARVTMFSEAAPAQVYQAFVHPEALKRFWLSQASAPLEVGKTVHWHFMAEGAQVDTTATELAPGRRIAWNWGDESRVVIDLEELDGGTAVTIVNDGFEKSGDEAIEAALDATEGFAIVLADLKTLLESGRSAGITRAKAKLIALRA